jgi:transposase-like protein
MNQNNSGVSESDQKPAKETAAARWRKLIEQQRESGLPVSAYCRERGISAASMFAWRRRLRSASGFSVDAQAGSPTFKPVKVVSGPPRSVRDVGEQVGEQPDSAIELCLRGGQRLILRLGFDRQLLIDLVQVMELLA